VIPNARRIGREAAALLDVLMRGEPPPCAEKYIPPAGIVVRQSIDVTAIEDPPVASALRFIRERACQGATCRACSAT
jgi:LacI family transcriptional regulator